LAAAAAGAATTGEMRALASRNATANTMLAVDDMTRR
jgi:hypothetical protein